MADFQFKQFMVDDCGCGMKICSDSVLLGAWFLPAVANARLVLDVGAGSGVLSLMAAQCCPDGHIVALEIEKAAAQACRYNFTRSPFGRRMETVEGDFAKYHPADKADALISNPPYFTGGGIAPAAARAKARHQASLTYAGLLNYASSVLSAGGRLGFIAPTEFDDEILFESTLAGLNLLRRSHVRTTPAKAPIRTMWDFIKGTAPCCAETDIDLRTASGTYTDEYRALVDPFYIRL